MNSFPSSLNVYDVRQFHNYGNHLKSGAIEFVAEHKLIDETNPPSHVVIHESGEFTVLARMNGTVYTDLYLNPKNSFLRFEFTPRYTVENTKIDVYPSTIVLKATDVIEELSSIASYYRGTTEPVHYSFENLSKAYAKALIDHHMAVAPDEPRYTYYQNSAPLEWSAE